jgi:hypothetical protein
MEPDSSKSGFAEFAQNWLVGKHGVNDSLRVYFVNHLNPYN